MEIKRDCYLIYYKGNRTVREIKKIAGLDIYYNSKRLRYLTVYIDAKDEKRIIHSIRQVKGMLKVEKSLLNQPNISIKV